MEEVVAQSRAELQDLVVATRFCRTLPAPPDRRAFLRDLCAFLPRKVRRRAGSILPRKAPSCHARAPSCLGCAGAGQVSSCSCPPQAEHGGGSEAHRSSGAGMHGGRGAPDVGSEVSTGELLKELQSLPNPATGRQVRGRCLCWRRGRGQSKMRVTRRIACAGGEGEVPRSLLPLDVLCCCIVGPRHGLLPSGPTAVLV